MNADGKVKVAIVNDYYGSTDETDEEERAWYIKALNGAGIPAVLVFGANVPYELKNAPDFDLLIVDYGGMAARNFELGLDQVRVVRRWAEEHPGHLVVMWTYFTVKLYKELVAEVGDLDNIIVRSEDPEEWDAFHNTLREWLGLPKKENSALAARHRLKRFLSISANNPL